MAMFQHHPDGLIYVRNGSQVYCDTPANFALDLEQAYSGLPSGYIERIYEPGVRHVLGTGSRQDSQPVAWQAGDNYIAALGSLLQNQAARTSAAPVLTLEQAIAAKLDELKQAAAAAYVGGFSSSASGKPLWYDSDQDTQNVINRQFLIALSSPETYSTTQYFAGVPAGVTPVRAKAGKDAPDISKTIHLFTAAQMVQLGNDLAASWAGVKATHWGLQAQVNQCTNAAMVSLISWPAGG